MATKFLEPGMDATQDGTFFVALNTGTGSTATYDSSQAHDGLGCRDRAAAACARSRHRGRRPPRREPRVLQGGDVQDR